MTRRFLILAVFTALAGQTQAQNAIEEQLCEAAKTNRTVELVYDKDASKGCLPRLIDVHQVAIGNNGSLYMHGWQHRGCTKGRDFEAKRIFKFEKIKSVTLIDGEFGEKSQATKAEGWDGCIGNNCFIKENICE
ncbi:MAG: WYL domain-containing protein [Planktotalea sp.]|uniref:WYL domain-containing protein n=1 Tax=Planktotalea sp. TaxID=2029877 RepID=UPI003C73D08D